MSVPDRDRRVTVDVLRTAVRRAVEATSLRGVARDIGMSAPGLQHFLDGGTPFRRTLRNLMAWYTRESATRREISDETVHAALAILLEGVPPEARAEMERKVIAVLRSAYSEQGLKPPGWTLDFNE